jgi:hypothetical protein
VTDLAHKLDKSIDSRINKDEYFVNKQQNRKFWEDTSIYLKVSHFSCIFLYLVTL